MNIINLYNKLAEDTWNRLDFATKTNSKFSEVTITENLLYNINRYRIENNDHSIQIYEAINEKKNGNDLEVYLEASTGKYIFLAIQAKKLYVKEQKYKAISHKVSGKFQIDILEDYANKMQGIGMYLLYNYVPTFKYKHKKKFGCSLVVAKHIKNTYAPKASGKWKIPSFSDLHIKNALPLFYLGKVRCLKKFINLYLPEPLLKEYDEDEIDTNDWSKVDIITDAIWEQCQSIKSNTKDNGQDLRNEFEYTFSPKYRIILKQQR